MTFEALVDGKYYLSVKSNKPVKIEETTISADDVDEDEEPDPVVQLDPDLQHEYPRELEFPEAELNLRMSQEDIIALCRKKTECDPWVKKDQDGMAVRFVDAEFKAEESSLFIHKEPSTAAVVLGAIEGREVQWLRPDKIDFNIKDNKQAPTPRLFKDDKTVNGGIVQGGLTDAWFLGALGMLATRPHLLRALFVDYSSACDDFGIYTVRFYKNGQWVKVTVDNRLPCSPQHCTMLFGRGADATELWVAVIEKAYAKLHGSYELLGQGTVPYALKDLTGGAPQMLTLTEADVVSRIKNGMLWKEMTLLLKSGSLLGAAIRHDKGRPEAKGIESKLCYAIVEVRDIELTQMYEDKTALRLVKLFNPWGKGTWQGPWSPQNELWGKYDSVREECANDPTREDVFWMEYDDFFKVFNTLYINRIFKDPWECSSVSGCWLRADPDLIVPRRDSAKGAPSHEKPGEWLENPQFLVYAREKTSCVMVLSQKDTRIHNPTSKNWQPNEYEKAIGFAVAKASVIKERGARMRRSDFIALSGYTPAPVCSSSERAVCLVGQASSDGA
jgi:hypothetical protein